LDNNLFYLIKLFAQLAHLCITVRRFINFLGGISVKNPGLTQVLSEKNPSAPAMEGAKQFIAENFERFLVGIILLAALGGTYFIQEPSVVLNFYYLPVLIASYFLGRRTGILAVFSILRDFFCVILFERFPGPVPMLMAAQLSREVSDPGQRRHGHALRAQ
jgi:hypothetical protein